MTGVAPLMDIPAHITADAPSPTSGVSPPATEDSGDRQLVRRAQSGDLNAFDDLVGRYQERIYALVYHMTSNHEDATDLAQEAFLKAWKALRNFKGDSTFYTWVYRIAVNHTLNHLKSRRQRSHHLSLNDLDFNAENDPGLVQLISENTPRRDINLRELGQRLNDAMMKLSEEHRTVVTLHDIQGLPHDEIAQILDCNPGTVRSRLFYARQQLQALLSDFLR
jgi:RNA polymerase sigma-70 factor (ECF subfamily)